MERLIPGLIFLPLLVVAFWIWMFMDMNQNYDLPRWMFWDLTGYDSLPNRRYNWALAFVVMNVIAAAIYYSTVYRNRR